MSDDADVRGEGIQQEAHTTATDHHQSFLMRNKKWGCAAAVVAFLLFTGLWANACWHELSRTAFYKAERNRDELTQKLKDMRNPNAPSNKRVALPSVWEHTYVIQPGKPVFLHLPELVGGASQLVDWTDPIGGCLEVYAGGRSIGQDCPGGDFLSGPRGEYPTWIFQSRSNIPATITVTVTRIR